LGVKRKITVMARKKRKKKGCFSQLGELGNGEKENLGGRKKKTNMSKLGRPEGGAMRWKGGNRETWSERYGGKAEKIIKKKEKNPKVQMRGKTATT